MPYRIWPIAHALLTLLSLGCCAYLLKEKFSAEPPRLDQSIDHSLRFLLDVKQMGGHYILPNGVKHCAVLVEEFVDGKYQRRLTASYFDPEKSGNRTLPFAILWGPTGTGFRVVGHGSTFGDEPNEFFSKLGVEVGDSFGQSDFGEYRGLRIVAFTASKEPRLGQEEKARISGGFAHALKTRKYIAIIGVKFFDTELEARTFLEDFSEKPEV